MARHTRVSRKGRRVPSHPLGDSVGGFGFLWGVFAGVLAGLDGQFFGDGGDGYAGVAQCAGEQERVLVDDLGAAAVVAAGRGGALAFEGLLADVVAVELGGDGADGEEHGAHPGRVVDAGQRAGEQFELDAGGLQSGRHGHQFGGVAGQAFHLVQVCRPDEVYTDPEVVACTQAILHRQGAGPSMTQPTPSSSPRSRVSRRQRSIATAEGSGLVGGAGTALRRVGSWLTDRARQGAHL